VYTERNLKLESPPINFSYFPENKNGNTKTTKGRLVNQNTSAKGTIFDLQSSFYVDDSFFIFQNRSDISKQKRTARCYKRAKYASDSPST
jgi:hypothetical protein